ncbi:MAG: hypothetical protein QNJ45_26295 [Ardenticatenaceae bacterium]|nr:hypothetical protein [Ardenticatenaceae bacterium]
MQRLTAAVGANDPRHVVIGGILITALLAFEMFNFDTTRYALTNLLGGVTFLGIGWATILAIAFCAIDFAGLARLFTPEGGRNEPHSSYYLMGAWLLGATMNAVMTWWAVSLTLLNHTLGNEILGREELLRMVPIFVAVLVWLTRILFIGSLTVAGEQFLGQNVPNELDEEVSRKAPANRKSTVSRKSPAKTRSNSKRNTSTNRRTQVRRPAAGTVGFSSSQTPDSVSFSSSPAAPAAPVPVREQTPPQVSRIRRRPPSAQFGGAPTKPVRNMQAKGHD